MFHKKNKIIIKLLGRAGILYKEGDKELEIDSEFLSGENGIIIYKNSIKIWDKPNGIELKEDEILRVIDNINSEMMSNKIPVKWQ